ncbi:hypothetical protein DHEL01_v201581 [Diaporthe helianthi]|uniref:Uncharacterized protein n=1 Tax=Diaporthe helianthi TaxID=158607 RepID=A0A2P5IC12_DIAHE|nr:hypothetical protein DHEL01_v201581 [Diaporthe helianthi]
MGPRRAGSAAAASYSYRSQPQPRQAAAHARLVEKDCRARDTLVQPDPIGLKAVGHRGGGRAAFPRRDRMSRQSATRPTKYTALVLPSNGFAVAPLPSAHLPFGFLHVDLALFDETPAATSATTKAHARWRAEGPASWRMKCAELAGSLIQTKCLVPEGPAEQPNKDVNHQVGCWKCPRERYSAVGDPGT